MSDDDEKQRPDGRAWRRRAVLAGMLLALVCHLLPPQYREPCRALASLCTGGI